MSMAATDRHVDAYRWLMSRRLRGVLLMLVVALAAVVVPAAGGIRVAGNAIPAAAPVPPAVGECLRDNAQIVPMSVEGRPIEDDGRAIVSFVGIGPVGHPYAPFGACDAGTHLEVVAVSSVIGPVRDAAPFAADDAGGCRADALKYAGLVPADGGFTLPGSLDVEPIAWRFSFNADARWMTPSLTLRSAGQTWAACVVSGPGGRAYLGSIRDAFSGGVLPDRFGTCWRSEHLSVGVKYVDCGTAHRSELIAIGSVAQSAWVDFDALVASCSRIAARVMGREDPTLSGQLRLATSPGAELWNRANRRSSSAVCYISSVSERPLSGTLIGIADRPVPWAE